LSACLRPDPLGELTAVLNSLAELRGALCGGEGREEKEGGERRKGKGYPRTKILVTAL